MRSLFAVLRSLSLPAGVPTSSPHLVIGPDIPPELTTFYAASPFFGNVFACFLAYGSATSYDYTCWAFDGIFAFKNTGTVAGGTVRHRTTETNTNFIFGYAVGGAMTVTFSQNGPATLAISSTAPFTIDALSAPRGFRDAMVSDNGTLATSTGPGFAETAVPAASWDQETTFTFVDGRLYRCSVNTAVINSAATATIAILRVRKGSASTTGTQLMYWEYPSAAGFLGAGEQSDHFGYIKNTSGSDVSTKLSLTIDQAAGAGNMSIFGDANRPVIVALEDIGKATDQPGIASMAVSV